MATSVTEVDAIIAELAKKLTELIGSHPDNTLARIFTQDYLKKHAGDSVAINILSKALIKCCSATDKHIRAYALRRYVLSLLCLADDIEAIAELGWLYAGIDCDETRLFGISQRDPTAALILLKTAADRGSFQACSTIAYICSAERDSHFAREYPRENIDEMLKKYLVKAFEIYGKPINNPNYIEDVGYLFKYVPAKIVIEIIATNPDFAKYFPIYPVVESKQ